MTEAKIKAKYLALHNELTEAYYSGKSDLTKEEFDIQHGKIWNDMRGELIAGGFLVIPPPVRDLEIEVDELKTKIQMIERSNQVK